MSKQTIDHYDSLIDDGKNKPVDKIPVVVYCESENGLGFIPTEYVDITDTFETKAAMCREHKSQVTWMQDNYKEILEGKDVFDGAEIMARFRGLQCGVTYAEGFRMAYDAYRVLPRRVLP